MISENEIKFEEYEKHGWYCMKGTYKGITCSLFIHRPKTKEKERKLKEILLEGFELEDKRAVQKQKASQMDVQSKA